MMKEKIFALLLGKFPNLRKDGLEQIAMSLSLVCSTEEQATELVGNMTAESVEENVKAWRKGVDVETQKAIETFKKTHQAPEPKSDDAKNAATPKQVEEPNNGMSVEAIAKLVSEAVASANKPLMEKIALLEGKEVASSRQSLLESELKGTPEIIRSSVMESFASRKFESDEDFTKFLDEKKGQISAFRQEMANDSLKNFAGEPYVPKGGGDKVSPEVEAFIKGKTEANNGLGGKSL